MANSDLQDLIARARNVVMTPGERERQRRSFVYGNTKIENQRITKQMVERASRKVHSHHE